MILDLTFGNIVVVAISLYLVFQFGHRAGWNAREKEYQRLVEEIILEQKLEEAKTIYVTVSRVDDILHIHEKKTGKFLVSGIDMEEVRVRLQKLDPTVNWRAYESDIEE